jgi:geranylgeranyl pyrophosphate synthase
LLAALALLNRAYALFGSNTCLLAEAVACIGADGMIGGQALDLAAKSSGPVSFNSRNRKTSSLLRLTLAAGALAGGASSNAVTALARAGEDLGEAYQVGDDLLDQLQDAGIRQPSHAAVFGREACHEQVSSLIGRARRTLEAQFGFTDEVAALMSKVMDCF